MITVSKCELSKISNKFLQLYFTVSFRRTDSPPDLHLLYGNMYIGGIPPAYVDRTGSLGTKKAFAGCIGDATLGGAIIDFSNSTDKRNEILGKCILDKSVGSDSDIHRGKFAA